MKTLAAAVALAALLGARAHAADPAPLALPEDLQLATHDSSPLPALPTIPGWKNLHTFSDGHWRLGLDVSPTAGACMERELHDGQFLAGPCRDVLLGAKDGKVVLHLGFGVMSNTEHGNTSFQLRPGVNVGPLLHYALTRVPVVDHLLDLNLPPFVSKLGNAMTLDFAGGYRPYHDAAVNGNWTYGVMVKVDVPLDTAFDWLKGGL